MQRCSLLRVSEVVLSEAEGSWFIAPVRIVCSHKVSCKQLAFAADCIQTTSRVDHCVLASACSRLCHLAELHLLLFCHSIEGS